MNSNGILTAYPKQASFERVLPKNKIYEHSEASARLKDLFVEQVEKITWQYKLAPETINLPASRNVLEIQIFRIVLRTKSLSLDILKCIDDAIPSCIIFELEYAGKIKVIATYKQVSERDANKRIISDYYSTEWLPANQVREAMPVALDLAGLYEALLQRLIPLAPRTDESFIALVTRLETVKAKQHEIEKTRTKLAKEKQFNRKVEINAALRQLNNELQELTA